MALLLASGCPREDPGPADTPKASPQEATAELRKEAQREALLRLTPMIATLAGLEHPVTAASRSGAPPRMPPIAAGDRAALIDALDTATREAEGITPRLLEPVDRVVALAAQFTLNRARDHYVRRAPWVEDPTWLTREAALVVGALEVSSRRTGTCTHCATSLPHLAAALEAGTAGVQDTSKARAEAAAADARTLAARVAALPGAPYETTTAALEAFAAAMTAKAATSTAAARWGPKPLQRHLEVDENVGEPPVEVFKSLGRAVATLAKMSQARTPTPAETPTPVTAERCEAAWSDLRPIVDAQKALKDTAFSCDAFVSGVGTATFDDVDLRIAIVDVGLVHPLRASALQALPEVLTSIGGHITRGSQAHTLRTALLLGDPKLAPAAARSLQAELDATCLTAAALWIHGELGDDAALAERLDPLCPKASDDYIGRAEARPRHALEGLGIARISMGPAGVVPLDKLWWLPLGLVDDVAMPAPVAEGTDAPPPVRAVVEPLAPGAEEPSP